MESSTAEFLERRLAFELLPMGVLYENLSELSRIRCSWAPVCMTVQCIFCLVAQCLQHIIGQPCRTVVSAIQMTIPSRPFGYDQV